MAGETRKCNGPCGEVKPLDVEHFYVERKGASGQPWYRAVCIPCYLAECRKRRAEDPERLAAARERNRLYAAERRRVDPEGQRDAVRRHREKVRADAKLRARRNETARLQVRLRAEQEGREMADRGSLTRRPDGGHIDRPEFPPLPALPLVLAVDAVVAREQREAMNPLARLAHPRPHDRHTPGSADAVCARLGISQRSLFAWRVGERELVHFDIVDEVLTRGEWLWWEVYEESTVRLTALTVTRWRPNRRKNQQGDGLRRGYVRESMMRIGDLGPDWEALARVEYAFTGETRDELALQRAKRAAALEAEAQGAA